MLTLTPTRPRTLLRIRARTQVEPRRCPPARERLRDGALRSRGGTHCEAARRGTAASAALPMALAQRAAHADAGARGGGGALPRILPARDAHVPRNGRVDGRRLWRGRRGAARHAHAAARARAFFGRQRRAYDPARVQRRAARWQGHPLRGRRARAGLRALAELLGPTAAPEQRASAHGRLARDLCTGGRRGRRR